MEGELRDGEGGVPSRLSYPVEGVGRTRRSLQWQGVGRRGVFSLGCRTLPSVFLVGAHFF